jgi:DNA-directed RNA polymerase specialized sigma24 family protein
MAKKKGADKPPSTNKATKAFLAWLSEIPDPQERYRRATAELERHQEAIVQISSVRAQAAAEAYESGESVRALAERLGLSPSRAHQLIQEANARSR